MMKSRLPSVVGIKALVVLAGLSLMVNLTACGSRGNQSSGGSAPSEAGKNDEAPATNLSVRLGIEACDSYIQKFMACISGKVTEETKIMLLAALEQSKAQWKQALGQGMAQATIEQSCQAALETAKQTMAQYQCEW